MTWTCNAADGRSVDGCGKRHRTRKAAMACCERYNRKAVRWVEPGDESTRNTLMKVILAGTDADLRAIWEDRYCPDVWKGRYCPDASPAPKVEGRA